MPKFLRLTPLKWHIHTVCVQIQYLCAVQESIDSMDVGVRPHHHSMGRDSSQVTVFVLRDLSLAALGTEQLEIFGQEIYCPRLKWVTCIKERWLTSSLIEKRLLKEESCVSWSYLFYHQCFGRQWSVWWKPHLQFLLPDTWMDKEANSVCYIQIKCVKKRIRQFLVPEGTVVSIVQVFSLLAFVLPWAVSHTQITQVTRETGLVGAWYAALLEETSHR